MACLLFLTYVYSPYAHAAPAPPSKVFYFAAFNSSSQLEAGRYMSFCNCEMPPSTLPPPHSWCTPHICSALPCPHSCCTLNIATWLLPVSAASTGKPPHHVVIPKLLPQDAAKWDCAASEWKPCRCLCFGSFVHVLYSTPFLRTVLQCLHIFFTEERTFISRSKVLKKKQETKRKGGKESKNKKTKNWNTP